MKHFDKKRIISLLTDLALIIISAFLSAFSLHYFIIPNNFVSGGVGGIATLLEVGGIMKSYIALIVLNAPILLIAWFMLSKVFAVKTIIYSVLVSVIMALMDKYQFGRFTDDRLLSAVMSGLLYGFAEGLIIKRNGCTGGTAVIAKLVASRKPNVKLSTVILLTDIVIILAGLSIFDIWSVVYAIIFAFAYQKAMDFYLFKEDKFTTCYLVTEHPSDFATALKNEFPREAYTVAMEDSEYKKGNNLMKLAIPNRKLYRFRTLVKNVDKDAFCYTAAANKAKSDS